MLGEKKGIWPKKSCSNYPAKVLFQSHIENPKRKGKINTHLLHVNIILVKLKKIKLAIKSILWEELLDTSLTHGQFLDNSPRAVKF